MSYLPAHLAATAPTQCLLILPSLVQVPPLENSNLKPYEEGDSEKRNSKFGDAKLTETIQNT